MSSKPTLINLPPPPSDPVTPSDMPGTPNSTTTSMSELSTVAIKDGHRGHLPHHSSTSSAFAPTHPSASNLDAERADRISRLAGLERFNAATTRNPSNLAPSTVAAPSQAQHPPTNAYFDAQGNPVLGRERSTVGSASATGSVGARTTWAGSEAGDLDKMSESADTADMEMDAASSIGGMSEEGGNNTPSLVGFGEGARTPARQSTYSSGRGGLAGAVPARNIDGMTYDADVVDTTASRPGTTEGSAVVGSGRSVREHMDTTSADRMRQGQQAQQLLGGRFGEK